MKYLGWLLGGAVLAHAGAGGAPAQPRRIDIAVTRAGYEPARIVVRRGEPIELVFTRRTDIACLKEVVVHTSEHTSVRKSLPLDQPIVISVTFDKTGQLGFTCGMMMKVGTIEVR